jgi:hypothetical protein
MLHFLHGNPRVASGCMMISCRLRSFSKIETNGHTQLIVNHTFHPNRTYLNAFLQLVRELSVSSVPFISGENGIGKTPI